MGKSEGSRPIYEWHESKKTEFGNRIMTEIGNIKNLEVDKVKNYILIPSRIGKGEEEENTSSWEIREICNGIDIPIKHLKGLGHNNCDCNEKGIKDVLRTEIMKEVEAKLIWPFEGTLTEGKEWTRQQVIDHQREKFNKMMRDE